MENNREREREKERERERGRERERVTRDEIVDAIAWKIIYAARVSLEIDYVFSRLARDCDAR